MRSCTRNWADTMGAIISTKSVGEAGWQQGGRHIWCSLRWRTRIGRRPGKAAEGRCKCAHVRSSGGRCSSTHLCTAGGCPPADTPSPNCCASPHACTAAQAFAHARWVARPCLNRRGWLGAAQAVAQHSRPCRAAHRARKQRLAAPAAACAQTLPTYGGLCQLQVKV